MSDISLYLQMHSYRYWQCRHGEMGVRVEERERETIVRTDGQTLCLALMISICTHTSRPRPLPAHLSPPGHKKLRSCVSNDTTICPCTLLTLESLAILAHKIISELP